MEPVLMKVLYECRKVKRGLAQQFGRTGCVKRLLFIIPDYHKSCLTSNLISSYECLE